MIESDKMEQQKVQLPYVQKRSIEEMRFGLNEIEMPFLERNELGQYFRQYPELKEMGFEGCKNKLSQGIEHILLQTQKNSKCFIHPCQSRSRYVQLQKWLMTHLQSLQQPQNHQQLSTLQYISQQKKLIITTYIQLQELFSTECKQKSQILKLITSLSLQIINTLLIELENTNANMLVGYLKEKNSSQKELIERIGSLEKTIEILEKEKNNKWKNLYIVVKDNRVMKKQNNKLIKMLNSEQEKVRILNEEHLKLKDQNEKFKLYFASDKEEETKKLSRYIQAKVQINQIDRLIKLYPKQAQKIAYAQLKNIQTSQLNTLEEKIAHIVKAIEKSGELVHEKDEGDDFLDTNKSKMCFNISVQTEKFTQEFGTNTYNKVLLTRQTQTTHQLKYNHFVVVKKVISEQVKPYQRQPKRSVQKKKTNLSMANIKSSLHKQNSKQESARQGSSKDMISNKKVKWNDDFLILRTVNFRYLPDHNNFADLKKQPSILRRKDFQSSSSSSSSERSENVKKEKNVRFESAPGQKRSRDVFDFNIKFNESRLRASKSKEKRVARFENLHTFNSKSKMKDFRLNESELWKINKTYNLSIKEQSKFCLNVFVSTFEDRSKKRKTSVISGYSNNSNQKFFQTTFPGALKSSHEEKYEDENGSSSRMEKQQECANKSKNVSETKMPQAVNRKIYRASKEKIANASLQLRKNLSKISNTSNQSKMLPKKSIQRNVIPKINAKKRDRRQSQESLLSVSTANQPLDNRLSFQKDINEDIPKNDSLLRQIDNQEIVKRSSQFSRAGITSHVLKAKKYNRQTSVLLNRLKNPNLILMTQMGHKRESELSYASLIQKSNHMRTKTQGIDQIDQTAEQQMTTKFKHLRGSVERMKDLPMIHNLSEVQSEFQQTLKPKNRFYLMNLVDMERLQQVDSYRYDGEDDFGSIDQVKSIERVIKNISQRSVEIIKKEYLFKQFLLSFYKLQYGNSKQNIPKSYVQFLKELKNPRYSNNPMVQCLYLLMNETFSQVYRREIFKLFTILIDKNGGSLTDYEGEHQFYKKIMTELLEIFIDSTQVQSVIKPMCLEQLNASLSDYFIAIEGEIRKRSINSQLYTFMIQNVMQFGETTVSFDIIKEITFFITHGNKRVKNQLIELRMYSEPYIELHRLCLIVGRLKFTEFMQIGSLVDKKYNELKKNTGLEMSPQTMVNLLAKQRFDNFPYLKQVLHRQIECFYKYNSPISENLLKLCQVNLLSQKLQNESPISDCLRVINQQSEKLQRLRHYKQVLENTPK